jgi:lipopolysaccharide cholinephosphotransferase
MLREEYDKFYEVCKKELDTKRFFLQEERTDPYYIFGYEKLRRLNTEFVREGQEHLKNKTGVFIDIFVADNVPDNFIIRRIHLFICFVIRKLLYSEIGRKKEKNCLKRICYKVFSLIPRDFSFYIRNTVAKRCNKKRTELIRHMTHNYKLSRFGLPRVCFDEFCELDFHGYKFKAFKNYNLYLTKLYNDYMTLPPIEERKSHLAASKIELIDVEV